MRKQLSFFVLVGIISMLRIWAGSALAVTLSLEPGSQVILPSETTTVKLNIAGLGPFAAPSLGAFGVEVIFDETILSFDSVTFGDRLGIPDGDYGVGIDPPFETDIFVDSSLPGVVLLDEVSFLFDFELDALQPTSFTLATLTFTGLAGGSTILDFGLVDLSDALGSTITPTRLEAANVNVVPEPATWMLLATGLFSLLVRQVLKRRERLL